MNKQLKKELSYWKKQGFKKVFIMGNENEISHEGMHNQYHKELKRIAKRVEKMTTI